MKFVSSALAFLSIMLLSNAVSSVQGRESVAELRQLRALGKFRNGTWGGDNGRDHGVPAPVPAPAPSSESGDSADATNTTDILSEEELRSEAQESRISKGGRIGITIGILGAAIVALVAGCLLCKNKQKKSSAVVAAAAAAKPAGGLEEMTTASETPSSNP